MSCSKSVSRVARAAAQNGISTASSKFASVVGALRPGGQNALPRTREEFLTGALKVLLLSTVEPVEAEVLSNVATLYATKATGKVDGFIRRRKAKVEKT